jgi:lysophospholipase L1-like esterase
MDVANNAVPAIHEGSRAGSQGGANGQITLTEPASAAGTVVTEKEQKEPDMFSSEWFESWWDWLVEWWDWLYEWWDWFWLKFEKYFEEEEKETRILYGAFGFLLVFLLFQAFHPHVLIDKSVFDPHHHWYEAGGEAGQQARDMSRAMGWSRAGWPSTLQPFVIVTLGDQVTENTGCLTSGSHSWPTLLQERVGLGFTVFNFAAHSTAVTRDAAKDYRGTAEYVAAKYMMPEIAIFMFGLVDGAWFNWNETRFVEGYVDLVRSFQTNEEMSKATGLEVRKTRSPARGQSDAWKPPQRIVFLTPLPVKQHQYLGYVGSQAVGIFDHPSYNINLPKAVRRVAAQFSHSTVIDTEAAMKAAGLSQAQATCDGVHPTPAMNMVLSKIVFDTLNLPSANVFPWLMPPYRAQAEANWTWPHVGEKESAPDCIVRKPQVDRDGIGAADHAEEKPATLGSDSGAAPKPSTAADASASTPPASASSNSVAPALVGQPTPRSTHGWLGLSTARIGLVFLLGYLAGVASSGKPKGFTIRGSRRGYHELQ